MTNEELKAELTALFDEALLAGEMLPANADKMTSLLTTHEGIAAGLFNADKTFKRKGQMIAGLLLAQRLDKGTRMAEIRGQIQTNPGDARNN